MADLGRVGVVNDVVVDWLAVGWMGGWADGLVGEWLGRVCGWMGGCVSVAHDFEKREWVGGWLWRLGGCVDGWLGGLALHSSRPGFSQLLTGCLLLAG